jgi:uncharacterized protein (TIGR00369 family)
MPLSRLSVPGAVTYLGRIVEPPEANSQGTLHGGQALHLMDEAAGVAAMRYSRGAVVTAHVDAVDFHAPVQIGMFLQASARVVAVGRTSMAVEVVLESEDLHTGERTVTTTGHFVLVAVDSTGHPRPIPEAEAAD